MLVRGVGGKLSVGVLGVACPSIGGVTVFSSSGR
jgi:hypothetical protein